MATASFNIPAFRAQFPEFSDPVAYPDARLTAYYTTATAYINPVNYGMSVDQLNQSLNLMTAHLLSIGTGVSGGNTPGLLNSATVDKVSYTLVAPKDLNQFGLWLNYTPYGAQLYALLGIISAGGWSIGGLPETSAFRKFGGIF